MKKLLIIQAILLSAFLAGASAYANSGWTIDNQSEGTAEISEESFLSGKALHVENTGSGDITVSHLIAGTSTVRKNFRVTFYMNGSYDEEKIMVGTGTKTTGSNPAVITYMSVSHEKVEKTDQGDGITKYSYIFRGSIANNSVFKFVFSPGFGEAYIDNVSISYDSSTDGDYSATGQAILEDGGFEDKITSQTGFDIEPYGWTSNVDSAQTSQAAAAGNEITPIVRVIEDTDGNRMLYAKYNSNMWNNTGLLLTKTIEKTGWEDFYITFKVKGAFNPNSVMVGSKYDDRLYRLVGGDGSSEENPYGDNVTAEELGDGWTKYTVKTYGEGTVFRIKIHSLALEMYLDDFEVVNSAGKRLSVKNSGFENIDYDADKVFAEGFAAVNIDEKAFAQREIIKGGYAIYLTSDSTAKRAGFYQTVNEVNVGDTYTISFDAKSSFEKCAIKADLANDVNSAYGQEFLQLGKKMQNYSFSLKAQGDKLVFVTSGECEGVWIDNVSVKDSNGNELIINGDFEIKTQPPCYTVENIKLLKNKEEAQIGQGVYTVSAEVENNFGSADMEFTMILSHDRGGEMIKYCEKAITLNPNGEDGEPTLLECDIDLSDYIDGDILEVYIWDNTESQNALAPYVYFSN